MALAEDIVTRLQSAGVGTPAVNLFIGHMPISPDTCMTVSERGGAPPIRAMGASLSSPVADQPMFQVMVRGATYLEARGKVDAIINTLDHFSGMIGSTRYLLIELSYAPVQMGQDENRRTVFSVMFNVRKTRS